MKDSKILYNVSNVYIRRMRIRHLIFVLTTMVLILFMWYYIIIFCAIFPKTATGWIYACLNNLIINWFGLELIIPIIVAIVRGMVRLCKLE
jgi:hypothetical protein